MISALRPLGALLAAVALWSLGLLVLATAGLGGQVGLHPDNGALAPPLPQVELATVGSRLGPASDYLELGNRPLLSADRRPAPVTAAGEGAGDAPLDVTLTSVMIAGDFKMAIVQGKDDTRSLRVRLGDMIEGTAWRLVDLEPRRAVFEGPQGRSELELRVFDGSGGATPVSGTGAPPMAAVPAPPPAGRQGEVAEAAPATEPEPVAQQATTEMTQEQQVEAIRRRIEARRAQMRAENVRREGQQVE